MGSGWRERLKDRQRRLAMESLENRRLLTTTTQSYPPLWTPTNNNVFDAQHGPLADEGADLVSIYKEYQDYIGKLPAGHSVDFVSTKAKEINFRGNSVEIDARGYGPGSTFVANLKALGMQVTQTLAQANDTMVEGYIPVAQLPAIAQMSQMIGVTPSYRPFTSATYTGQANNEAATALGAPTAIQTYGVNGTGVTVGVLSDSVNKYAGGIADSVKTGDIPSASRVNVLQDGPDGGTDEGRAMIENVFDVAPGVNTAFASAFNGELSFASNIQALANQAHAQVITDDVTYLDEPMFQVGPIAQAVQNVVNSGVVYTSSAANAGDDGYQSPWRGVTANPFGSGSGLFQNFNTGAGAAQPTVTMTVPDGATIALQWDNPFYTQNGVTSNVVLDIWDASGNQVVGPANNSNALATQEPLQAFDLPAGTYTMAVQVTTAATPGEIRFQQIGDGVINFGFTAANAGTGVTFPTSFGHNATPGAIGTGATPFWGEGSYIPTIKSGPANTNEGYSSTGPSIQFFAADGTRLAVPQAVLEPLVSAPDGGNTSFFSPGNIIDTTSTPFPFFPGEPVSKTNQSQNLPSFFGTSSAAPNMAGVAALMKQLDPFATPALVAQGLVASATPLNGAAAGTWDPQGGYGEVNASAALAFVNQLRVTSILPGSGQLVGQAPAFLQVTFNQPVSFASITAADLAVKGPSGTIVTVGNPIPIGSPTTPTIVDFPITITHAAGVVAEGTYYDAVFNVVGANGRVMIPSPVDSFTVADITAPRITSTSYAGRTITITFSEPIDPSSVNKNNFTLIRSNTPSGALGTGSQVNVSADSRVTLSYNPATATVTMDLSGLPQTLLPSDTYGLIVNSATTNGGNNGVTDIVGLALDGEFNGSTFPTGNGVPGGNFGQILANRQLTGPIFNYVQLSSASDSGIKGDQNTNVQQPTFVGQLGSNFPGTVAGVIVLAEFNGIAHNSTTTGRPEAPGTIDLAVGIGGRGFAGNYDTYAVTDSTGKFTITAPKGLPDGLNNVTFVAIAPADQTVLPGLSTQAALNFRVDTSLPTLDTTGTHTNGSSIPTGSNINSLSTLTLYITDPVNPKALGSPFSVPTLLSVPALDPQTANNISNYSLLLLDPNGKLSIGGNNYDDESSFISSATFTSTTKRVFTSDPYTGTITLTFAPGLPSGTYFLAAHTPGNGYTGITDAAGNALAGNLSAPGAPSNYILTFNLQAAPAYITNVSANSGATSSGPRSYFEEPASANLPNSDGTPTPPTTFTIDFSTPLQAVNSSGAPINYSNLVQLIASADTPGGTPDGNFGTLGTSDSGSGYSVVPNTLVTLTSIPLPGGAMPAPGQPGYNQRLILTGALDVAGNPSLLSLAPDYYRLYIPNNINPTTGVDARIFDIYGNQMDGEFLGDQTANGTYEDLLPTGQYRPGISGDGVAGGSFATAYEVVPYGNVIFANPSYQYDPYNPAQYPNGSPSRPYPVLAPEATPNSINGGNLNSPLNYGPNFNPIYDRSGDGQFEPSALYAAQVASANGPVVVVAEPGTIITNPTTGQQTQSTFVLQAPRQVNAGINSGLNDGSVAVPTMTTLLFQPGSTLKLQNASLLVQNQGSALEALGGSSQPVTFTSYADDTVGGDTNRDLSNTLPQPGDWGGILFRNFDQQNSAANFPGQIPITGVPGVDNRLKGPGGADAISGADDLMSSINFAVVKYGGGLVPYGSATRYDAVTMQAARPSITNSTLSGAGGSSGDAGLSVDMDALREDELARGPLLRRLTFSNNALNGIYIRGEANGVAEPTDAMTYPVNQSNQGGAQNYVMDDPYPYLLTTPITIGSVYQQATHQQTSEPDRLYIQPGMMVKFESGTGIEIQSLGTSGRQPSLNVGVRTYLNEFDANPNLSPTLADGTPNPNFVANSTDNATVLFTSFFDDKATTSYTNPNNQVSTTIVAALPVSGTGANNPYQPSPSNVPTQARWGGIQIDSPSVAVINNATFQYGGGNVNTPTGTTGRNVLNFAGAQAILTGGGPFGIGNVTGQGTGTHVSITDNNFYYNADAPMNITPDGLYAGNLQTPLASGAPFFHNNVMVGNDYNALRVSGTPPTAITGIIFREDDTLDVNSVWPGSDLTYFVGDTISLAGSSGFFGGVQASGGGNFTQPGSEPVAPNTLTVESTLPGTILADGTVVPKPGISAIIKLGDKAINGNAQPGGAPAIGNTTTGTLGSEDEEGAGFVSGMDNGVDPTADPLIDIGVNSQMRFLGIGANQATGQTRVPVVLTSVHDNTYGTTVRGVTMNVLITGDTQAAAPGDGGNIIFGSHTMTTFDLNDPRQGNLIDNVDLKYLSRVEQIGGGIIDLYDVLGANGFDPTKEPTYGEKIGQPITLTDPLTGIAQTFYGPEYNQPNAMTISSSNFSDFRDFDVWAHPGFPPITVPENFNGSVARAGVAIGQQATMTYLVNDTFYNTQASANNPATAAVELDSNTVNDSGFPSPTEAILLNNTFYNNNIGINVNNPLVPGTTTTINGALPGIAYNGQNAFSSVDFLAMNNIFANQKTAAIDLNRQVWGSQSQYNLYSGNTGGNVVFGTAVSGWGGDSHPVSGDPGFVDAAAGDFNLTKSSAAINAARSELGPAIIGDMLYPAADQVLTAQGGVLNFIGRSNPYGGNGYAPSGNDFVYLPGSPLPSYVPNYVSSWVPVLPTSPYAVPGPASNAGTWDYAPLVAVDQAANPSVVPTPGGGERDQNGVQRYDYQPVPITGYGSQPYFDIGAYEFVQYNPPEVTGVTANFISPTTGTATVSNIYSVGGIAGTNVAPQSIQVQFNHQIDPTTINSQTVILEGSSDGTFNTNSPTTTIINLAGKLSFDPTTDILTISLGASGLILGNDEYRLILVGTGSQELRDPQGNALDGENLDTTGQQKALPSGDQIPGGNFQLTFTVDTHPPALIPGTFSLSPVSYTNPDYVGSGITNQNQPTFQGTISDIFPPANPVQGDTVYIDVSSQGNGVFDLLNAGVGTTDANGNFSVRLTTTVPDSPYSVGPDGILGTADDSGYTEARVRVIDQSGNVSNTTAGTLQSFAAQGALYNFVVDTSPPKVTAVTPTANTVTQAVNGVIPFSVTFNKNIDPKTINANTVQVVRSGGDGVFGNGNDVTMAIDPTSIKVTYLKTNRLGPETVTFNVIGSANAPVANDTYRLTLKGTGTSPIEDIAGNPLAGGAGTSPGDYTTPYIVYSPSLVHNIFVGPSIDVTNATAKLGSYANPYPTITAGLAAANVGDVVAVLPGVYTESITLKSLVTLESASLFSTDSQVLPGNPIQTIIRAPMSASPTTTVTGTNLISAAGGALNTAITGFTIASPLVGNAASGPISPYSYGLSLTNSSVVVSNDDIVDSGQGVWIVASGANAAMPTLVNDVIAGNITGVGVSDTASSLANGLGVYNSDFVFNTYGLVVNANVGPAMAVVANNIFWQNRSPDGSTGFAVGSTNSNLILLYSNMFADNGASLTSPADDTYGIAGPGGFDPSVLTTGKPDTWGNFVGEPAFVAPRDPRPTGDGPAIFFLDGNFDLTSTSAAIDRANPNFAPSTDMYYRGRVSSGKAWSVPAIGGNSGPADVGAFEYNGTGGIGTQVTGTTLFSGGTFVGTALSTVSQFSAGSVSTVSRPAALNIKFSAPVNAATIAATDLVINGLGSNGIKATSVIQVDAQTVEFVLTGGYNQSGGVVNFSLAKGKVISTTGHVLTGFNETVSVGSTSPPVPVPPVPVTPVPTVPTSPGSGGSTSPVVTPPPPPPSHSQG